MSNADRPDAPVPGTGTTPTTPPTPAGGPPVASPPPQSAGGDGGGAGREVTGRAAETGKEVADTGREVAGHARSEAEEAAQHAVEQGERVAETAKSEVHDVVDEARDALRQQADRQAGVAAGALGELRDDLRAMSDGDTPRDATAEYLQRAARSLDGVVERLDNEGIEGALSGIRGFARRSPGSFLLASAGAGFALGRVLRNGDHPQQVAQGQSGGGSGSARVPARTEDTEIDLTGDDAGEGRLLSGADVQNRSLVDRGVR